LSLTKKAEDFFWRQTRPDDKCQDPFPLTAVESGLFLPIFLLAPPQKGFPLNRCRNTAAWKIIPLCFYFKINKNI